MPEILREHRGSARRDPTVWVTQDKRRVKINEMGDAHLTNTIRFLKNKYGHVEWNLENWPVYKNLVAERISRDGREWDT